MLKIEKHHSLARADRVLQALKTMLKSKPINNQPRKVKVPVSLSLGVWSNCREQGYNLFVCGIDCYGFVWAECRGSDEVLVVNGDWKEFEIQTHQPSDKIWDTRKYFSSENEAAKYIHSTLRELVKEDAKKSEK